MQKLEIIGNLGADAEVKTYNGGEFVSFRVADTQRVTVNGQQTDQTTWFEVTMNGNGGGLLKYLKAGTKIFVSGRPSYRIYDSAKYRCKMVGVSIFANQVELCGYREDVPNELSDPDGQLFKVVKCYWADGCAGKTLIDGDNKQYKADENGFIIPEK